MKNTGLNYLYTKYKLYVNSQKILYLHKVLCYNEKDKVCFTEVIL